MKKLNKVIFTILMFILVSTLSVKAESSHTVDFSKKGSLTVTLTEKEHDEPIENAEITIYKIADAKSKDNNLVFEYTEELKECKVSLSNLKANNLTNDIEKCVQGITSDLIKKTNNKGVAKFNDLDLGLYLVTQSKSVKGYSNIDSFLIMTPKVENNKWIYNIKSAPKTEIYKTIDVKVIKVWNKQNEKNELPKQVTIQLLKGEELIDQVILNKDNNWTHTWEDIEKSDKYQVIEIDIPEGYTPSYKVENNVYTITNTDKLPETGQVYLPIIILSGLGILLITIGLFELKKESNEN